MWHKYIYTLERSTKGIKDRNNMLIKTLIMVMLLSLGCTGLKVRSSGRVVKLGLDSSVGLVMSDGGSMRVYCSAVWISKEEILTANHCIEASLREKLGKRKENSDEEVLINGLGAEINYVVRGDELGIGEGVRKYYIGTVVKVDRDHDLALIKVRDKLVHSVVELSNEMPGLGEHVVIVGHVKGLWFSVIDGVISGYRENLPGLKIKGPYVQISGPVYYGNSGGGAFDRDGKLVGICSFMSRAPLTNFFISADVIEKFIR